MCSILEHVLNLNIDKEVNVLKFGSFLRKTREQAGLSQIKMAQLLHMSRSSVSKLENDKLDLKAETLLKWTKIVASQRCGQAYEAAAVALCSIDVATVIDGLMKILGG